LTESIGARGIRSDQVLAKYLIDRRLVALAGGVGALAESFEYIVVDMDRDPCLPALADYRTPLALAEVAFLLRWHVIPAASGGEDGATSRAYTLRVPKILTTSFPEILATCQ